MNELLTLLILGLVVIVFISLYQGHKLSEIQIMILQGSRKSLVVLKIFVLIGIITSVWRACGTVAFMVYYGIAFINAQYFILFAFLLCCLVSYLLGTSFGTVGTIGVALIVLAKSANLDLNIAAGAILAGAYFGDRCSPMSSSANLVATLTDTNLYVNLKNMLRTSLVPLGLSIVGYALVSYYHPLDVQNSQLPNEILQLFQIPLLVLVPAIIILAAPIFKVDVKLSMVISILASLYLGIAIQNKTLFEMAHYIVYGYQLDPASPLASIMQGGGLLSMVNVIAIVLISSAYSGIFEETGMLKQVESFFDKLSQKVGVYPTTILTSTTTAALACNQTLAIILAHQFENKIYEKHQLSQYKLALDLENTVILISALVPWNIACAFPLAALSADADSIVYAFYLFLVPLMNLRFSKQQGI